MVFLPTDSIVIYCTRKGDGHYSITATATENGIMQKVGFRVEPTHTVVELLDSVGPLVDRLCAVVHLLQTGDEF